MYYIQRKDGQGLETVDETPDFKEAREWTSEYRLADPYGIYYVSTRPCKQWKDK